MEHPSNAVGQPEASIHASGFAAAETEPFGRESVCDSPTCINDKDAEAAEMPARVSQLTS
jgi:hypothetical protein